MAARRSKREPTTAQLATVATTRTSFAMVPAKRSYKVSTAALRQIGDESKQSRRRRRQISQSDREWQTDCFDMADKVGELGALLEMQANTLSLCGFPVRRWDEDAAAWVANDPLPEDQKAKDGEPKKKDPYDARPGNVMRAFIGPDGGPEELYRRCGYHLFCVGESQLLATKIDDGLLWEFLSVEELRLQADGTYARYENGFAGQPVVLDEAETDFYTARIHQSSARYSGLATSQVKRVLPILQEIVTLTMMVDAVAKSRVAANMLFIPDELSFAPDPEPSDEEGEETDADTPPGDQNDDDGVVDEATLIDDLFDHMTAPLIDPGSSARLVPIIIRGKAEYGKEIRVISLARELDMWAQELRMEALGRLAQGLDAPPEAMAGKGSANHWTAANIDTEFIVKHIQPQGRRIAAFLTTAYLRPMLIQYENMTEDEAENWMIEFDPSPVIARADEAKSARDLADWLSDEALLSACGFTKADLANTETLRQRRLWTLVKEAPAVYGRLIHLINGFEDITEDMIGEVGTPLDAEPQTDPSADPADPNADSKNEQGQTGDKTKGDKVVDETSGTETPDKPQQLALLIERIVTAADMSVRRARELVANRAISTFQDDQMVKMRLQNVPKRRILSTLTVEEQQRCAPHVAKLVSGVMEDFTNDTRSWIADHLVRDGMSIPEAEATAGTAAATLAGRLTSFATDTLFAPPLRNGNGLHVATEMVADVVEQAVLVPVA